jgi:hypothetical protein
VCQSLDKQWLLQGKYLFKLIPLPRLRALNAAVLGFATLQRATPFPSEYPNTFVVVTLIRFKLNKCSGALISLWLQA